MTMLIFAGRFGHQPIEVFMSRPYSFLIRFCEKLQISMEAIPQTFGG